MGLSWVGNFAEKTICMTFDRSSQADLHVNPAEHSIPTLHINTLWASLKQRLKHFDHGLPTIQIRILIH